MTKPSRRQQLWPDDGPGGRLGAMAIGGCLAGLAGVRGRRAGLVAAVAAGLFAVGLAGAPGASAVTFVHSATSGELRGGRLVLHGVSGRVTYFNSSGRTAVASVKRVHKGVFLPGRPATGVLHVEGHRGGDEPSFKLSRPRYNAARRTVSFKARRLDSKRLAPGAAGAAGIARTRSLFGTSSQTGPSVEFGPSSLTVNSLPTVAPDWPAGNTCEAWILNNTAAVPDVVLTATAYSAWDTDTWIVNPPLGVVTNKLDPHSQGQWISQGGNLRGCHNEVTFGLRQNGDTSPGSLTIEVTWPWGQLPSSTCDVSDPVYKFKCTRADANGNIIWSIEPG
jgi:hypothetical protein